MFNYILATLTTSNVHDGLTVDKIENIKDDFPIQVNTPSSSHTSDDISFEAEDIESAISADTDVRPSFFFIFNSVDILTYIDP